MVKFVHSLQRDRVQASAADFMVLAVKFRGVFDKVDSGEQRRCVNQVVQAAIGLQFEFGGPRLGLRSGSAPLLA